MSGIDTAPLEDEAGMLAALGSGEDAPPVVDAKPKRVRVRKPRPSRAKAAAAGATSSGAAPRVRSSRSRAVQIRPGIERLYTMAGLGASMLPNPTAQAVGLAMGAQAGACADAWDALARENPRVKAALEQLLTVSSVGVLLAAHAPIVLAGLSASGHMPAPIGGDVLARVAAEEAAREAAGEFRVAANGGPAGG